LIQKQGSSFVGIIIIKIKNESKQKNNKTIEIKNEIGLIIHLASLKYFSNIKSSPENIKHFRRR